MIFEVHWKSGDVTWLPYYQITHLQALTDYLELIGVSQISNLPNGSGRPPVDDPQVFLGSISVISPLDNPLDKLLSSPIIITAGLIFKRLYQTLHSTFFPDTLTTSHSTITNPSPPLTMPSRCSANHPYFSHISDTHYQITEPGSRVTTTVHIGQITDYVNFDEDVRTHGGMTRIQSMPLGYPEFANLWNMGTRRGDHRRFSHVYMPEGTAEYQVQLFRQLVNISEFTITETQIGMAPPTSALQAELTQEFAYVMMEQRRNSCRGFKRRQDQRLSRINQRPSVRATADGRAELAGDLKLKIFTE